jgi:hypothetical protein
MQLDSFDCELCLLRREEKLWYVFFKCPFAKNCWNIIGIAVPTWLKVERVTRQIKRKLRVPFAMDIIIIMCWSIWKERNAWIFNNEDPQIERCRNTFSREFALVIHRAKLSWSQNMQSWLANLS